MASDTVSQFGRSVTLKPHPYELAQAVTTDHVVVFGYNEDGVQFEVSGESDHDDLNIDWGDIKIDADEVGRMLAEDHVYRERCEDLAGHTYELQVRAGERHPKGTPVHTQGEDR